MLSNEAVLEEVAFDLSCPADSEDQSLPLQRLCALFEELLVVILGCPRLQADLVWLEDALTNEDNELVCFSGGPTARMRGR